jgi:hypothetical protein
MPDLNLNLSEATSFELIPEGPYSAIVGGYEVKQSAKGVPMILVRFEITDEPYSNVIVSRNYMLAGAGAGFTADLIEALTGTKPDWDDPEYTFDPDDMVGTSCRIVNTHRTHEGTEYNNVQAVLAE